MSTKFWIWEHLSRDFWNVLDCPVKMRTIDSEQTGEELGTMTLQDISRIFGNFRKNFEQKLASRLHIRRISRRETLRKREIK